MRPSKTFHPDRGSTGKRTYYETRGKVHLVHHFKDEPPDLADKAWCGVKLENCNNITSKVESCTCQKCLMIATREWRTK